MHTDTQLIRATENPYTNTAFHRDYSRIFKKRKKEIKEKERKENERKVTFKII